MPGSICTHCGTTIAGRPLTGRPRPDRSVGNYCCYGCLSLGEQEPSTNPAGLDSTIIRLLIGLLFAGQSMALSLAVNLTPPDDSTTRLALHGLLLAVSLVVVAILGVPLMLLTFSDLRNGRLSIESLFIVSLSGAMGMSLMSMIRGTGPVYFEVVSILLVVYSLGRLIGAKRRESALASARRWTFSLSQARRADGAMVNVVEICPGDLVEVRAGELVAVDGIIRQGIGYVTEAPVSGEPFPVVRRPGDRLLAGCASFDATFWVEAMAAGNSRQIDRLLRAVDEARAAPGALTRQADRVGQLFTPLVVAVAMITSISWTVAVDWQTGLFNSMAVLLVACPCAIGLATPIVVWSALGRLGERGFLVHGGDAIERLASADSIVFDKTGTLTDDQFVLIDFVANSEWNRAELLRWIAVVESHSCHPIASAFARFSEEPVINVESSRLIAGAGIDATIHTSLGVQHRVRVGRLDWLGAEAMAVQLHASAGQRIAVEIDGRIAAVAIVAERLRESVVDALDHLNHMKLPVFVWSGDPSTAWKHSLFPHLPPDRVRSSLSPEDKHQMMRDMISVGKSPIFVGDGINDSAALASAHFSIAMDSGTDLANGAAGATLYHGDLRVLPWAVQLCRDAVASMRRSLWRAGLYNLVGILLAALGVLHPVAAALLMVASSALVAWSASRACDAHESDDAVVYWPRWRLRIVTIGHGIVLGVQGFIWAGMLDLQGSAAWLTPAVFVSVGVFAASVWRRWSEIPHHVDMALGMLTLGNFGMLIGWWADGDFTVLCEHCACRCSPFESPLMWLGMVLFGNAAMAWLSRRPNAMHWTAWLGGNFGMAAGMWLGGYVAQSGPVEHYLGMTLGMIIGMAAGHEFSVLFRPATISNPTAGQFA